MGQSTDAILVWGFDLGDYTDFPEALSDRIEYLTDEGYKELEALEKSIGVELVGHCSGEHRMYIVGVSKTKTLASRGYPVVITSLKLSIVKAQAALDAFAKELGIEPKPGQWLLASDWS